MIAHTDLDGGDRLISKDEFFRRLQLAYLDKEIDEVGQEAYNTAVHINMLLYQMPFADAKYVRHGRWITDVYKFGKERHTCSECGEGSRCNSSYCPACGAKMDLCEVEK